jgi:hypothetical protein
MLLRRMLAMGWLIVVGFMQPGCESFGGRDSADQDFSIVSVADDFEFDEPSDAWTLRTPALWRIGAEGDRRFLQMLPQPQRAMMPGVRRPQEYAVYNKFEFRSFALACYVRIDRDPSVKGRDACIIFGRQDNTHFYYAHLSNYSDGVHNNLIRVDGQTRQSLLPADASRRPAIVDCNWHRVDVVRDVDAGTIKVYVDLDRGPKDQPPLFEAVDRTYDWGFVALASFDDHASFGRLGIEGEARPAHRAPDADGPPAAPSG